MMRFTYFYEFDLAKKSNLTLSLLKTKTPDCEMSLAQVCFHKLIQPCVGPGLTGRRLRRGCACQLLQQKGKKIPTTPLGIEQA